MDGIEPVDIIVATLLTIAGIRGFLLGLVREMFSLTGIAGAYIMVRLFNDSAAEWLVSISGGQITAAVAPFAAGAALVVATVVTVTMVGRIVRRGVRAVGLGMADRIAGAALGAAEGALVVALLLVLAGRAVGWNHPAIAETRTLAALQRFDVLTQVEEASRVDVAAPPPGRR